MDFNLTGYFWGWPVNFSGDVSNFTIGTPEGIASIVSNAAMATPWYITTGAALLGALVGGIITYLVAYKGQKYELRRDAYLALIELRIRGGYPSPVGWRLDHTPTFSREVFFCQIQNRSDWQQKYKTNCRRDGWITIS